MESFDSTAGKAANTSSRVEANTDRNIAKRINFLMLVELTNNKTNVDLGQAFHIERCNIQLLCFKTIANALSGYE